MKQKTIGIAWCGHSLEDQMYLLDFTGQHGIPVWVMPDSPTPKLDLLIIWDDNYAKAARLSGTSTVNQWAERSVEQFSGHNCPTIFFGAAACIYWSDLYGSKQVVFTKDNYDTYHSCMTTKNILKEFLPSLKLAQEDSVGYFSVASHHHQTMVYDAFKTEQFQIITRSLTMNQRKFKNLPIKKVQQYVGDPEVMIHKKDTVAVSLSSPHKLLNPTDSYYRRQFGYAIGDPVSNALMQHFLNPQSPPENDQLQPVLAGN